MKLPQKPYYSGLEPLSVYETRSALADLLKTGKGSDLVIKCQHKQFHVHQAFVTKQSDSLMAAYLAGRNDGGDLWGRHSNSIWLPNDDPFLVDKMIQYFYTEDYESDNNTGLFIVKPGPRGKPEAPELTMDGIADLETRNSVRLLQTSFPHVKLSICLEALRQNDLDYARAVSALEMQEIADGVQDYGEMSTAPSTDRITPFPELALHAAMYGTGDRFAAAGLKRLAKTKLRTALQGPGWSLGSAAAYTSNNNIMMRELAAAISAAWNVNATPKADKGVRNPLLEYVERNRDVLLGLERFEHVLGQTPGFAVDLLWLKVKREKEEAEAERRMEVIMRMSVEEILERERELREGGRGV